MSSAPLQHLDVLLDLHLPLSQGTPAYTPTKASTCTASMATHSQKRLLYIEDNAINTLVVEELLSRRPALSLSCEEDGARGLQSAQAQPPELILLDMHLPDCDGYEVLKQLRADPRTAHIPCIALSANAMDEDHRRALEAGFLAYWTKPIDFKAFLDGLDAFFAPSLQASTQDFSPPR